MRCRAMHLAKRGGRCRVQIELCEFLAPLRAEFGHHAALDEGCAHGRGIGLQLLQFFCEFWRQKIGDGRHELCDFHQRPFEATESRAQSRRTAGNILQA